MKRKNDKRVFTLELCEKEIILENTIFHCN